MTNDDNAATDAGTEEEYAGADLDTIEVPDDVLEVLDEMATQPEDKSEDGEASESGDGEQKTDKEESDDESKKDDDNDSKDEKELSDEDKEKQKKRDLYNAPRNKLVREWHTAHEEAAAQKARNEILEQELQHLKEGTKEDDPLHELIGQQKTLVDQCDQAAADADLEAYNKARLELDDVQDQIRELKFPKAAKEEESSSASHTDSDAGSESGSHPAAQEWMDRNEWFFNPRNKHLAAYAEQVEKQLRDDEGMKFGPKLYERLDQELAEMPEFEGVIGQGKKAPGNKNDSGDKNDDGDDQSTDTPRHLMSPSRPGNSHAKATKPGELTSYDIKTMKMAKLDPNNPDHKKAYLKYKR